MSKNSEQFCNMLLESYKKLNLDNIEIFEKNSESLSVKTRNIKLENIERSNNYKLTLTVFKGKKTTNLSVNNIEQINPIDLLEKAKDMVVSLPEDIFSGIPEKEDYPQLVPNLNIKDPKEVNETDLLNKALITEEAMLQNKNITNTEGSNASRTLLKSKIYSSVGFVSSYTKTINSTSAIAIAGKDTNMQRDYEYGTSIFYDNLPDPKCIGNKAAERALSRINSKKIKSCKVDIIFEPRIAKSILSSFSSCATGVAIARGTSFLIGKKEKKIFKDGINIINQPHLKGGIGSTPYDYNGVKNEDLFIVSDGSLDNYFLNIRSARQLNLKPNGNSSPYNLTLQNGKPSPNELISNIKKGFFVTEMLGMSFNPVNGDYSRGAAGFLIENGEITYPVSEVTIAGNMIDMMKNLTPANDLKIEENINTPTFLIENMTLAGQ